MDGIAFLVAITIPQCLGDEQQVQVIVRNPTDKRARVRFGIEFTSIGGLRERGIEAGGPVAAHWLGDAAFHEWTPFKTHFGVVPDPSLVVSRVRLLNIQVCPDPAPTGGRLEARYSSCGGRVGQTLETTPPCPEAQVDAQYGYTSLMLAARSGNSSLLTQLLACGSDVNASASDGYTALMFAANSGVVANAELLLRGGARVNARQDHGLTALAIVGDAVPPMAELLRRYGGTR